MSKIKKDIESERIVIHFRDGLIFSIPRKSLGQGSAARQLVLGLAYMILETYAVSQLPTAVKS